MKTKKLIFLAVLEIMCSILLILFWIYFFLFENNNPELSEVYLMHERAFPVPDLGFLLPCLILGAIGILRKKSYGLLFSIMAGSSMIFLALLDTTFSILIGLFTESLTNAIVYGLIACILIGVGSSLIIVLWKNRNELL